MLMNFLNSEVTLPAKYLASLFSVENLQTYATIILAFATVLMAFSTWRYATNQKRDRERDKILERIHYVLYTSIKKIKENDIYHIDKDGPIFYSQGTRFKFPKKFEAFFDKKTAYSLSFYDIVGRYPFLMPLFKIRLRNSDKISNKLNSLYDDFDRFFDNNDEINRMIERLNEPTPNKEYKAKCKNCIIDKWNLNNPELEKSNREFLQKNKEILEKMSQEIPQKIKEDIWYTEKRLMKHDKIIIKKTRKNNRKI